MALRTGVVALLAVSVLIAAGCGGDDSTVSPAPGAVGAEQRVHEFMTAELEGDVDTACGYVSDDLATKLTQQTASCEVLVESQQVLADAGEARFEDKPITVDEVEGIEFETKLGDGDSTATVTGPRGRQSFELEVVDGEWTITAIPGTSA